MTMEDLGHLAVAGVFLYLSYQWGRAVEMTKESRRKGP